MTQNRIRIVDVADALGLSTATVSKVIHGKTEKISDKTVKRVQQELERSGYIPNMAGILLARNNSRIIGVVVNDGYFEKCSKVVNLVIDHYNGGYQAGKYLKELGHKKALCIADNFICMDKERIEGFRKAFEQGETYRWEIPKTEKERMCFYEDHYMQLLKNSVTAVFAVSDFYALEFMRFLQGKNFRIPEDIQIIGFDDNMASRESNPSLTTIHQEANLRAKAAIECLEAMRDGAEYKTEIVLPVDLVKRESTRKL